MTKKFTELEHLELVARRIAESGVDITTTYVDWLNVGFACASLGEPAREYYHIISSQHPGYTREECDEKFDNCLETGHGEVTLGTLIKMAKDAGIDTSLPRGRREKTSREKKEERENQVRQMKDALKQQGQWRFNTWRQRPEYCEQDGVWKPVQDRDLDTLYCRLKEQGINVKQQDVKALIFSRDFCPDYDAVNSWLNSLKPWNPDTDPDYLRDFYIGHLEFGDPENESLYQQMLTKWHVGMVAQMKGQITENPLMPIFIGHQHIGKTYFARHILPPELSSYRLEVGPSERIDKDLIISLSETPLILFDEISFGSNQKNEAFKYIVTSSRSNVRDAYAHFRESRQRRASLIATTNENNFLRDDQGNRRYLAVDLKGTVDLKNFPLPYEGAYAQALYLLDHGFDPKPTQEESQLITKHNRNFMEYNDCEEVLRTFLSIPDGQSTEEALSAGDIMRELNERGFRGAEFKANSIGKVMKRLGFNSKVIRGTRKYLVTKIDDDKHYRENKQDVQQFVPDL